jgi:hypothetical protein
MCLIEHLKELVKTCRMARVPQLRAGASLPRIPKSLRKFVFGLRESSRGLAIGEGAVLQKKYSPPLQSPNPEALTRRKTNLRSDLGIPCAAYRFAKSCPRRRGVLKQRPRTLFRALLWYDFALRFASIGCSCAHFPPLAKRVPSRVDSQTDLRSLKGNFCVVSSCSKSPYSRSSFMVWVRFL